MHEIFETDSGVWVAFVAPFGSGGVFVLREPDQWIFHPADTVIWDSLHQQVYRNGRADRKSEKELLASGRPAPPGAAPSTPAKPAHWGADFKSEVPFDSVPQAVRDRLLKSQEATTVYLVLFEDEYETSFGDGKYLYPKAAFWNESEAASLPAEKGFKLKTKKVVLKPDPAQKKLVAELGVELYEHYSIDEVLKLLPETLGG